MFSDTMTRKGLLDDSISARGRLARGLTFFGRSLLGLLLIVAAAAKLVVFGDFVNFVMDQTMLNESLSLTAANVVVSIEFGLGAFLLFKVFVSFSLKALLVVLSFFSLFVLYLLLWVDVQDCMCFGNLDVLNGSMLSLLRNLAMMAIAVLLLRRSTEKTRYMLPLAILFLTFLGMRTIYNADALSSVADGVYPISVLEANALLRTDSLVFIDARSRNVYEHERLPNAVSIPYGPRSEIREAIAELKEIQPKRIVTYCDSKVCNLAHNLAQVITQELDLEVAYLDGGLEAWKESGYPTHSN